MNDRPERYNAYSIQYEAAGVDDSTLKAFLETNLSKFLGYSLPVVACMPL